MAPIDLEDELDLDLDFDDLDDEDVLGEDALAAELASAQLDLSQFSQEFIDQLVDRIMLFMVELVGYELFAYEDEPARRIVESVIINDGAEISVLFSRQSGKTETLADVVAVLMILLPRLAPMFPDLLGKFAAGFWVGTFAPTEDQASILYGRIVDRLTSERAIGILLDEEIDDYVVGKGKELKLKKCGSLVRMQTVNPRAKIEGRTFHLIIVDEAQDADEFTVRKSVHPMGAFVNATLVKTGTPTTHKGDFYKAIQLNKRMQTKHGARQNHYEADWRVCAKYNKNYGRYVRSEMLRLGPDSDEFMLAYGLKWLLERGLFITQTKLDDLGDRTMECIPAYWQSPVVVGIDPARKQDSTVVTVVYVNWDQPDHLGYYDHRVLNWLELHGDDWEPQYAQIVEFLANYDVLGIAVDTQGVGDAVAQRLDVLMPRTEVFALASDNASQSLRWKHLLQLIERNMIGWPAHSKTKRLRKWKRFYQQMLDLEKRWDGAFFLAEAPEEAEAHDDFPDSLALACMLTKGLTMPQASQSANPFYTRSR